jgi:hypothetical protein
MRVPRNINTAWQTFNAWQHRKVIDEVVFSYPMDPLGIDYHSTPTSFTPHKVTIFSGTFASAVSATKIPKGLL